MNFDLLKQILIIAMSSSVIVTSLVQKIKESCLKTSDLCIFISFTSSMIIGTLFAISFSNITFEYSLWVGLFTFIGADTLYKTFEEKIFKSFSTLNKEIQDE